MKRLLFVFAISGMLLNCSNSETDKEVNEEATAVAEEVSIPKLSIANFEAEASNYIDSEVNISGIVDHVCKHGGKKLLLVSDDGSVHVEADERFEDAIVGQEVNLNGIVREFRVDEGYCLKMEEDNIASHKEGETTEEDFENKKNMIQSYRDSMAVAGIDHLSYYSLDFVSFNEDIE